MALVLGSVLRSGGEWGKVIPVGNRQERTRSTAVRINRQARTDTSERHERWPGRESGVRWKPPSSCRNSVEQVVEEVPVERLERAPSQPKPVRAMAAHKPVTKAVNSNSGCGQETTERSL